MSEYVTLWVDDLPDLKRGEEIVRCRDCTRYIPQGTYRFNSGVVNKDTCDVIRGFAVQIDPDGFCAWACRKAVKR